MCRTTIYLLSLIVLVLTTAVSARTSAMAQDKKPKPDVSRIERLVEASSKKDDVSKLTPEIVPSDLLDEAGKAALRESLTAYYAYRTSGFDHRRRVFAWQLLSSKIIFALVVFLVAIGVYFSWLQFRAGLPVKGESEDSPAQTTIEASVKGVKVSSPVLGVIILTLSLAFFYLYLVYVYPIEEIL